MVGAARHRGMYADKLDHRITIQHPIEARTNSGSDEATYQDLHTLWASKSEANPAEEELAMRETMSQGVDWTIRYRSGINAKMIVKDHEDNIYDIVGTSEIGRKRFLSIKTVLRL